MNVTATPDSIFPSVKNSPRGLVRNFTSGGMTLEPEQTEEEKRLAASTISFQKQLTPEEENRVLFLKNLLGQLLTMADGQPSEEQKSRIREIEKELEKITGVKTKSSISNLTSKIPGKKDEKEEEEKNQRAAQGIPPEEAIHSQLAQAGEAMNPGMQMLQRNASMLKLTSFLDSSLPLSSLS